MSALAAILAGHVPSGLHRWHGAADVADVRHTVEHAGWCFAYVDGWTGADSKAAILAALGEALDFPDHYGQNFDALTDCLRDIGRDADGVVLLWDGWTTLARTDVQAFDIVLDVLGSRAHAERGVPFSVLLRGEGPDVSGVSGLD